MQTLSATSKFVSPKKLRAKSAGKSTIVDGVAAEPDRADFSNSRINHGALTGNTSALRRLVGEVSAEHRVLSEMVGRLVADYCFEEIVEMVTPLIGDSDAG